ncbi:unnamed protein product [Cercopithifilaria johnstoni]|uniref:Globin domain-containing protein n=1 Tax=Cercopithifilaria johnstoni TaxID=2874296 RepID=A0A8J2M2J7_9BILA|nr:unnamed protein product [Cercopithifilaria johnstoni]
MDDKRDILSTEINAISSMLNDRIGISKYQRCNAINQQNPDLPGPSIERKMRFFSTNKAKKMEQNERRLKFISAYGSLTIRSFETGELSDVEVTMKPFKDRSRSMSPLKQMKTYSFRSMPSEEGIISEIQQELIRQSWHTITTKLESSTKQEFGFYVYQRVFKQYPSMKRVFHVEEYDSLDSVPENHSVFRQTRLFTNLISLTVRHLDELETEIAPAFFRYGQRHYTLAREYFNEESLRLFCSQVVCTVADHSGADINPACIEAWIELMRYIGCKLLDGFNYMRLTTTKKLCINTSDHFFYVL